VDRKALETKLYAQMNVEPRADGSTAVTLEGGIVGRYWQDTDAGHWHYEWCSRDGVFHPGVGALEQDNPKEAARWALTEIAGLLAARAQAMDNEFGAGP
jgi:hypothetical protein